MAFPKYMELRSLKTGSPQAQKQFRSVRLAADSILRLAVCLGCTYLIAVMLPASWGLKGSPWVGDRHCRGGGDSGNLGRLRLPARLLERH
jgi:hypothetical protein